MKGDNNKKYMDIATTRPKRPKGRFGENNDSKEPIKENSDFEISSPVREKNEPTVVEHKTKESLKKVQFKCDKCDYSYKKK